MVHGVFSGAGENVSSPFEIAHPDDLEPPKPRELAFLHHYLPGCGCKPSCQFNQTKAGVAIGLSPKCAEQTTGNYLRKPRIQAAIARKMMKLELSTDRVLLELIRLAFADPAALYEADGKTFKNIHDIDPSVRAAIGSMEWNESGPKYKLHSKTETLRLLAKVMDMVKDRVVLEGQFDLSVIAEALKRVRVGGPGGDRYGSEFYLPGEGPADQGNGANGLAALPPGTAVEVGTGEPPGGSDVPAEEIEQRGPADDKGGD